MTYRVTFDGNRNIDSESIGNVAYWYMSGDTVVLVFLNGKAYGRRGFVDFEVEPEDES